ncbi:MAG: ATP-binding protein, partial [Actinobacteria bacterium]|nr:ATP-binding protein [Actinomycetota bacterium]
PLGSVAGLPALAAGERAPAPLPLRLWTGPAPGAPDLADLRGQPHLRHALEVAAAGGHSLLMVGPPGAGKSLAASRLPSILPPLGEAEALEVARIASATGRLGAGLPAGRPFRAPHHTISAAGLIGGGTPPRPGEITLAHRGLLFLDELCEFRPGEVAIARVGGRRKLPCRFMLVAASNPCPCGRGEDDPACTCLAAQVQRYQGKLSGALADRIDLLAAVTQPSAEEIGGPPGESSAVVRDRGRAARARQEARLGEGRSNAEMTAAEVRECAIDPGAAALLADLYARRRLSGRSHDRSLRLARTVADLAGAERIGEEEMAQALQLRRRDRV